MTTADSMEARFWDRAARRYAAQPISDIPAYEKTLERTRAWLNPESRVLEIGCGTGSTALLLAPDAGHITGSDISREMIAIANENCAVGGPDNVDFIVATPFDARLEAYGYDVVLAFNILHLLEDMPAALIRLCSLIKPGGLLISKTPCVGDMGIWLRLLIPAMRLFDKAPPVRFFSKKELRSAIERAGFIIEEAGLHAGKGHGLFIVARKK